MGRCAHSVLAMNGYRNYSNNTTALGRNLEKLSSGYKINRAGGGIVQTVNGTQGTAGDKKTPAALRLTLAV